MGKYEKLVKWVTPAVQKRMADMLEKLGVASLIWGLFQGVMYAYVVTALSICMSLVITYKLEKEELKRGD